uniref:uncharacterized protein n=1 Tax=Myxine glutinosa TaxID=7769 RepID=UPI00358EAADB
MFHLHSRLFAADLLNLYQELDSIRNFSNASSALEKSPELAKVRFKLHWGKNSLDEQALSYLLACWEVADTFTQLFLHGQDLSKDLKIADVNNDALRTFCRRAREKVMKKDLKGAVDVCTEATSHFPFTFFPYQNRSVCYMMLGDFNAAAADVKRALLLHPQWSQGFELLARALHRCGWSQLALRLTRLALYKVKSKGLDPTDLSLQEKKLVAYCHQMKLIEEREKPLHDGEKHSTRLYEKQDFSTHRENGAQVSSELPNPLPHKVWPWLLVPDGALTISSSLSNNSHNLSPMSKTIDISSDNLHQTRVSDCNALDACDPNLPDIHDPDTPGTHDPDTLGTHDPDTPGTHDPDTPGTHDPDTPGTHDPDTPGTHDPDTPDTRDPNMPGSCDPNMPGSCDPDMPATRNTNTPATRDPDTPATRDPDAPTSRDPDTPATCDPDVPTARDPDVLTMRDPDVPAACDTDFPAARDPDVPAARDPDVPAARDPDVPAARDPDAPAARDPDAPADRDPDAPAARDPDAPAARDPDAHAARDPDAPNARDPDAPAAREPDAPAAREPDAPAARDPDAPAARDPDAPAARDPDAPAAHDPDAPAACDPDAPAARDPDAPAARDPDAPAARDPDAPAARDPDAPAARDPDAPAARDPDAPAARDPDSPAARDPDAPAARDPDAPAARDPDAPAARDPDAHAARDPDAHAARDPDAHAARDPDAHAARDPDAHAARDPDAHAARDPDAPAARDPDVPTARDPDVPTARDPAIPAARNLDVPSDRGHDTLGIRNPSNHNTGSARHISPCIVNPSAHVPCPSSAHDPVTPGASTKDSGTPRSLDCASLKLNATIINSQRSVTHDKCKNNRNKGRHSIDDRKSTTEEKLKEEELEKGPDKSKEGKELGIKGLKYSVADDTNSERHRFIFTPRHSKIIKKVEVKELEVEATHNSLVSLREIEDGQKDVLECIGADSFADESLGVADTLEKPANAMDTRKYVSEMLKRGKKKRKSNLKQFLLRWQASSANRSTRNKSNEEKVEEGQDVIVMNMDEDLVVEKEGEEEQLVEVDEKDGHVVVDDDDDDDDEDDEEEEEEEEERVLVEEFGAKAGLVKEGVVGKDGVGQQETCEPEVGMERKDQIPTALNKEPSLTGVSGECHFSECAGTFIKNVKKTPDEEFILVSRKAKKKERRKKNDKRDFPSKIDLSASSVHNDSSEDQILTPLNPFATEFLPEAFDTVNNSTGDLGAADFELEPALENIQETEENKMIHARLKSLVEET